MKEFISYIIANWKEIAEGLLAVFGGLALLVKLTPTLKDDNIVKGIIKILGKLTNKQID